ncbi:hypothetical protein QJQ45_001830 [Haematococcus lacustris]|nr:hypothetical protein QJQ45_001830 [Haematococcus lacustris]
MLTSAPCTSSGRPQACQAGHRQLHHRHIQLHGRTLLWRGTRVAALDNDDDKRGGGSQATADSPRIVKTLTGLDALLGIQEEPSPKHGGSDPSSASSSSSGTNISISSQALQQLAEAESQRIANLQGDSRKAGPMKEELEGQFQKIIEKARKLADEQSKQPGSSQSESEQQQLRKEFESLLQTLVKPAETLSKEDIKRLKEAAFGPQTFWVTETQTISEAERSGLLIRGNLRDERAKVYEHISAKVRELFGDKYELLMVEDAAAEAAQGVGSSSSARLGGDSSRGARPSGAAAQAQLLNTPRVAFQLVPAAQATPPQTNGWQQVVAFVLALLFVGSCGQLALAANITKLPKETLEFFSNPANFESDVLPPGLETWDPTAYFNTVVPIFSAVLGVNVVHEVGHRVAAWMRSVRLGPTFFVPNFQVGAFGGITPITSLLKDRLALWDVAAAGPLAGCLMATVLLGVGLMQSTSGNLAAELMVPVPAQLFQGSLLLGSVVRAVLGDQALASAEVLVSPLVIAGWCGLVAQALQLLPVGSTDGGRMFQSAFGNQGLALSSLFTYLGLGLGLLGSSLALPYGLYVIVCQREAEKYIRDNVTPTGEGRAAATGLALVLAILVLLPMAPELADGLGVGAGSQMFL